VYAKGNDIIHIEGDPHSPINQGTLCPNEIYVLRRVWVGSAHALIRQLAHAPTEPAEHARLACSASDGAMMRPIDEICREAIRLVEEALGKPPAELKAEVDVAERTIACVRDELIERLRAAPDPELRIALDNVNAALSLVVGIEYPLGGIQRDLLKQAHAALESALAHCVATA
jgi:hypothetical protein